MRQLKLRHTYYFKKNPSHESNVLSSIVHVDIDLSSSRAQVVHDINSSLPSLRLSASEKRAGAALLRAQGPAGPRAPRQRQAVELARTWPFYFARLFAARVPPGENAVLAVSHSAVTIGVKGQLIQQRSNHYIFISDNMTSFY